MAQIRRSIFALLLTSCVLTSSSYVDNEANTVLTVTDEDQLMEPIIVPEPENGSPWWYTPSRKAHMFKHRYQSAIRKQELQQEKNKRFQSKQGEDMRLPGDIIPIEYNIRMFPFVELIETGNYTTDGYVEILIQCVRTTRNISINSAELVFKKLTISVG